MAKSERDVFDEIVKNLEHSGSVLHADNGVNRMRTNRGSTDEVYQAESERFRAGFRDSWTLYDFSHADDVVRHLQLTGSRRRVDPLKFVTTASRVDPDSRVTAAGASSPAEEPTKSATALGFGLLYRGFWCFLSIAGLIWGVVLGGAIGGDLGIGPSTVATGTVVLLGLVATLFVAGRKGSHQN